LSGAAQAASEGAGSLRRATVAYVAPFAAFIAFLGVERLFPGAQANVQAARFVLVAVLLAAVSRPWIPLRPRRPVASALLGVAVFAVWIGPDLVWPGYRAHWLFRNSLTGAAASSMDAGLQANVWFLAQRVATSVLLVPLLEELFWRGWMMRWLVKPNFLTVPLGTYTAQSFWLVAVLFASEHGPYWEVGLAAGIAYNWWLVRTRDLAGCVLAHAVTNACLAAYVLLRGEWQYWL